MVSTSNSYNVDYSSISGVEDGDKYAQKKSNAVKAECLGNANNTERQDSLEDNFADRLRQWFVIDRLSSVGSISRRAIDVTPKKQRLIWGLFVVFGFLGSMQSFAEIDPSKIVSKAEMDQRMNEYYQQTDATTLPFMLTSSSKGGVVSTSVRTFLPGISFSVFANQLQKVKEWCEFVTLHLNIKSCSFDTTPNAQKLGFYVGVKTYLTPDQASLLSMNFHSEVIDGVLHIHFYAKDGPYDSSNYDFRFRAIAGNSGENTNDQSSRDKGETGVYLEFDLSSVPGYVANLANVYLLTVGRNKIGFSKDGETWTGKTKYVKGKRGAAERNVVRYLLAIRTYFETLNVDPTQRYQQSLEHWFNATEEFSRQLYEMDKSTYLSIKKRERRNQYILMEARRNNVKPIYAPDIERLR